MMFEQTVRRVVEAGRTHRWLRPLGVLALLTLFGGAALARGAGRLCARTRETVLRASAALGELRRDYMELRERGKEKAGAAKPVGAPCRPARRAAAGALAACMLLTLLPVSARAAESGGPRASMNTILDDASERYEPQLVRMSDGRQVLLYLASVDGRAGYNRQALYYSICDSNGIWGQPKLVEDDGTADAAPFAAAQGEKVYILWSNGASVLDESATLPDALRNMHKIRFTVLDLSQDDPAPADVRVALNGNANDLYLGPTMSFWGDGTRGTTYMRHMDLTGVSDVGDLDGFLAARAKTVECRSWREETNYDGLMSFTLRFDNAPLSVLDLDQGTAMQRRTGSNIAATRAHLYTEASDGRVRLYLADLGNLGPLTYLGSPIPLSRDGAVCTSPRVLAGGDVLVLAWIEGGDTLRCADLRPVIAELGADATGADLYGALTSAQEAGTLNVFSRRFPDSAGTPMALRDCRPVLGADGGVYLFFSGTDSDTGCRELYTALCLPEAGADAPAGLSGAVRVTRLAEKQGGPWALDEVSAVVDEGSNILAMGNLHPLQGTVSHNLVSVEYTPAFSPEASIALETAVPVSGVETAVSVTVTNRSTLPADSLTVKVGLGSTSIGEKTAVSLRGGESRTLRFPWTPGDELNAAGPTLAAAVLSGGQTLCTAALPAFPVPTADGSGEAIYANGMPLLLAAGSTDATKTVVYLDKNNNGQLDEGTDEIFDPDGSGTAYDGTAAGNDLSEWAIFGGGKDTTLTADTKLTMTGGVVGYLYGGGNSGGAVTGDPSVTVSGGTVYAVCGGGNGAVDGSPSVAMTGGAVTYLYGGGRNGAVSGRPSVTVGGGAVTGKDAYGGVVINGGTNPTITHGVGSFAIGPALTETASVNVDLPAGYDASSNPTIATNAAAGDLAKIKLVGDGATGRETYFENDAIKVREKKSTDATLSALTYKVGNDGQTTAVSGFAADTLTYDVTLPYDTAADAAITLTGTPATGATITENDGVTLVNGSGAATIKVTAEDRSSTKTYTVNFSIATGTRSDAKQITAFTISGQAGETVIDQNNHTITVSMPSGTDVTGLAPTVTVSDKATVSPTSCTAQNFANPVTYTVTAENGTTQIYTVTVTVQAPSGTAPTITTGSLPDGAVGTAYSQTLAATSGTPITWSVSEGSLPGGLVLNSSTGVISGTPATAGTSTFTVTAENSGGSATKELSIKIDAATPTVTGVTVSPSTATVKKGTAQQFSATITGENNPAQTVTWTVEGGVSGTTITDGLLTVASEETAATLTVTATSTVDDTESATATVTVTDEEVTRYTLTVTHGNGSGDYAENTEITVTAEIKANKRFKEWTATGIPLADATANPVTITMPADAVTLTATYDDLYTVTTSSDGNGTAAASLNTAAAGETVAITATANDGYQFKEWQVVSGGVSLADAAAATASFTMPGAAVEVKAIFELQTTPPPTHYTLTVIGSYASATGEGSYSAGETVTIHAGSRSEYSFSGWTGPNSISFANANSAATTFPMPADNVTVTAHWTCTGGSSSSGGGSSDSSHTTAEKNPDGSTTTTVTKPGGTVIETTKAPDGTKTVVETRKDGTKTETVETPDGVKAETITTPQGDRTYTEQRPDGTRISAHSPRSGGAAAAVALPESAGETVVSFPATDGTVVLRVLPDGAVEPVPFSLVEDGRVYVRLDAGAELRVETRTGLFDDMDGHWAEEFADFTGARALFEGVAARNFAPERTMTRAMLTTVLYRLDGEPEAGAAAFDDVSPGAWYAPGAAWASEHGIAVGDGGAFRGQRAVTWQELAVTLWNYARYDGLDVSAGGDSLSYPDMEAAAEWALPALRWACGAGILPGDRDGAPDPAGSITRAEAAAALQCYVELAVKP